MVAGQVQRGVPTLYLYRDSLSSQRNTHIEGGISGRVLREHGSCPHWRGLA